MPTTPSAAPVAPAAPTAPAAPATPATPAAPGGVSAPNAGKDPATPANSATTACPDDCCKKKFPPVEVSDSVTEVISGAPTAYSAWNGTYTWTSKFTLAVDRPGCSVTATVKIQVTGTITAAQKSAWKSAIEGKWSDRMKLVCPDPACKAACPDGYPIKIKVQYVDSGAHQVVTANTPTATTGGRSGQGGTTSMNGWGAGDTVDVTHEFGHMLGAPEEYFTTNGTDYTDGGKNTGFRSATGGVMNNPAHKPRTGNYELIRKHAATAMGTSCTVRAI